MKLLIILFFILNFSSILINAETAAEARVRWTEMGLGKTKIEKLYKDLKAKEKRDNDYRVWRENLTEKDYKTAYVILKNTIVGGDRDRYIQLYNKILDNGGRFNPERVKSNGGFWVLDGWSIAKITKIIPKSNVVKIQYKRVFSEHIIEGWVHFGQLRTIEEHNNSLAK